MRIIIKISYFAILFALVCLTGCAKSDDGGNIAVPSDEELITLRAEVGRITVEVETETESEAQTRAPILSWLNDRVAFASGFDADNYYAHWNALISMHGQVVFSPVRPYDSEDRVMHLKGYHPRGEARDGDYNKVYITLTGNEDLMVSKDESIGKLTNKDDKATVRFEHKLAQFQFIASNNPSITTGNSTTIFPISGRLYKITLSGTPATPIRGEAMIDLTNNSVTYSGDPVSIVVYENTAGLPIANGSANFLSPVPIVMCEPEKKMQVTVEYGEDENNNTRKSVTQEIAVMSEPGHAYEITIAFSSVGFYTSYTWTPWTTVYTTNDVTGGDVVLW